MLVAVLTLGGCLGPHEGDDPGECSDGADNDRNGYFDCDDLQCMGSPVCQATGPGTEPVPDTETEPGTDPTPDTTDTDTGSTGGTVPPALDDYASYTVTMVVDWSFPTGAFEDCTLIYEGSGDAVEATPTRVTFDGPYTRTYTTCTSHDLISSAFPWYDDASGEALVSFKFTNGLSDLDEWYADPTETQQGVRAEWWMFDMAEPYDPALLYSHHEEGYVEMFGYFIVQYDVEVQFSL